MSLLLLIHIPGCILLLGTDPTTSCWITLRTTKVNQNEIKKKKKIRPPNPDLHVVWALHKRDILGVSLLAHDSDQRHMALRAVK
jgi:hypothetical protein